MTSQIHKKRSRLSYNFRKYFIIPIKIFLTAVRDTIRHDGIEHAGYLAFLSLLSVFPFLIFLIAIVGLFGASETSAHLVKMILVSAPKEMAQALIPRVDEIVLGPSQSLLTLAIIGVIWTASSSVEGCRTILNRAYRVALPPPYIFRRLISILEFLVITFLLVAGIIIFIIVPVFLKSAEEKLHLNFSMNYNFFYVSRFVIFTVLVCATSLLYFALPNVKQKITRTLPGSIMAVLLWITIKELFSIYLENFHQLNFVYGSLVGIIISLIFFYFIALVFIFGAEFNYHFHRVYQIFLRKSR